MVRGADRIILQANSQTQQAKLHVKVAQAARPRHRIVPATLATLGRTKGNVRCVLQENTCALGAMFDLWTKLFLSAPLPRDSELGLPLEID